MVQGKAWYSDPALARSLVTILLFQLRHSVWTLVFASQALHSICASCPSTISFASRGANHALLVTAWSIPRILAQDGLELSSSQLNYSILYLYTTICYHHLSAMVLGVNIITDCFAMFFETTNNR